MSWISSLVGSDVVASEPLVTSPTTSQCQLTYLNFHLIFTLPPLFFLYLLVRPFLTSLDRAKLVLLPLIAFVWTTPWDNIIVKFRAWSYPPSCVLARVGYVPVEEYAFFVIQSLMTTLLNVLLTRWALPLSMLPVVSSSGNATWQRGKGRHLLGFSDNALFSPTFLLPFLALVPPAAMLSFAPDQAMTLLSHFGHRFSSADIDHAYYMSMITWWALLPLGLLTWGTRSGMERTMRVNRSWWLSWIISLVLPTVYLWFADLYALRRGTWHITEAKSLNIFPIPELPIEEMVFFVATNAILTCACFAFERCLAVCYYRSELLSPSQSEAAAVSSLSPSHLPLCRWSTVKQLWQAFIVPGTLAEPATRPAKGSNGNGSSSTSSQSRDLSNLATALDVLGRASKSFSAAALLLPWDLRTDLSIVYAWCRAGDDLVDEEEHEDAQADEGKRAKMQLLHDLAEAVYGVEQRQRSEEEIRTSVHTCMHEYAEGEEARLAASSTGRDRRARRLQELEACTTAGLPLRRVIPLRLWKELLRGYEIDLGFVDAADPTPTTRATRARSGAQGLRIKSDRELMEYAQCVAGCVGEMCTRVVLYRCGRPIVDEELEAAERELDLVSRSKELRAEAEGAGRGGGSRPSLDLDKAEDLRTLLRDARRMGVALQLVNIARDVASDARDLKRCYLPIDPRGEQGWIGEALASGRIWPADGAATASEEQAKDEQRRVEPSHLRQPTLDLLSVASDLFVLSFPSLASLPSAPARAGLRAACAVYFRIAAKVKRSVQRQDWRGQRVSLSPWQRIRTAIKAVYWDGS